MGNNGKIFVKCKGGVMMNSRLFRKIIRAKGFSFGELARLSGIRKRVLIVKLWGLGEFRFWEIVRLWKVLKIDRKTVEKIFFG